MNKIQERLRTLSPAALKGIRRGIEKESLRVRPEGKLAMTSHPLALGSALTHPHITTDFSESQLELITGVHTGVDPDGKRWAQDQLVAAIVAALGK